MGLTVLGIEVGNPANPEVTEKLEFLIDSGAIYSVVLIPILERLGIKPSQNRSSDWRMELKSCVRRVLLFSSMEIE